MRSAHALGVGSAAQPADAADGLRPPLINQALGRQTTGGRMLATGLRSTDVDPVQYLRTGFAADLRLVGDAGGDLRPARLSVASFCRYRRRRPRTVSAGCRSRSDAQYRRATREVWRDHGAVRSRAIHAARYPGRCLGQRRRRIGAARIARSVRANVESARRTLRVLPAGTARRSIRPRVRAYARDHRLPHRSPTVLRSKSEKVGKGSSLVGRRDGS